MRTFAKLMTITFFSVVLLAACGDGEENATENDSVNTDNDITEVENGIDQDETSDEDTREEESPPVEEGEEREAQVTKENNYIQAGTFIGGEMTDGRGIKQIDHGIHDGYERLVFRIYEGAYGEFDGPAEIPNHFEVTKEAYPSRLVYTKSGIRGYPEEIPDLSEMAVFSDLKMIPLFDDSAIQLAAYVQEPIEFEVFELHDPARIVTDISLIEKENEDATVYSLRTTSISQEDIDRARFEFAERDAKQVRTLHAKGDTIFVEEGYYQTLEEAEERKAELENDGFDLELKIEERGMYDIPENIE